jgi:hypothetical protein
MRPHLPAVFSAEPVLKFSGAPVRRSAKSLPLGSLHSPCLCVASDSPLSPVSLGSLAVVVELPLHFSSKIAMLVLAASLAFKSRGSFSTHS